MNSTGFDKTCIALKLGYVQSIAALHDRGLSRGSVGLVWGSPWPLLPFLVLAPVYALFAPMHPCNFGKGRSVGYRKKIFISISKNVGIGCVSANGAIGTVGPIGTVGAINAGMLLAPAVLSVLSTPKLLMPFVDTDKVQYKLLIG